jgi:hypothetical protein
MFLISEIAFKIKLAVEGSVMAKKATRKRGPGRPPTTGIGVPVLLRCHERFLTAVDRWRAKQEGNVSRPDAIRRLAEFGLSGTQPMRQRSPKAAAKAFELAGEQIDKLIDPSATAEERQQRKRRLLKGPGEFRDLRSDLPKPKS